jgi:hypothetical protein
MTWLAFRRAPRAKKPDMSAYDAFISYSRALDGRLAPALQTALHRFTKPWYRLRALRVFRDDASLSANPGLWPSIEQALASSRFFILLASPEAARSKWVAQEATYWCRHKPLSNFLLALTDGELVWDEATRDFDWSRTTALPPSLRGSSTRSLAMSTCGGPAAKSTCRWMIHASAMAWRTCRHRCTAGPRSASASKNRRQAANASTRRRRQAPRRRPAPPRTPGAFSTQAVSDCSPMRPATARSSLAAACSAGSVSRMPAWALTIYPSAPSAIPSP